MDTVIIQKKPMAVVPWLSMRTHNTGVVSLIPPCITIKIPLVRKATGSHLIKPTSLEKAQSPVFGFCYSRNRVCNIVIIEDLLYE